MSSNLTNKREVRDYVKQALQSCVDAQLLDVEDQKSLIKSVADVTNVPITDSAVAISLYTSVTNHLVAIEAAEETVSAVKALLSPLQSAPTEADSAQNATPSGASAQTIAQPSAAPPSLSLSGLKARLAKRREEMQQTSSQTATTAAATAPTDSRSAGVPSLSMQREASHTGTAEPDRVSLADGTESHRPTAPVTANVSPAMGPARSVVSPAPMAHRDGEEDRTEVQSSLADGDRKAKPERVEVALTAAPIEEEDLYAGLPLVDPFEMEMSSYRGRGRGRGYAPYAFARGGYAAPPGDFYAHPPPPGSAPYRGRGGGYRGRGGAFPGEPHPQYYQPAAPYRGRYPS